MSKNKGGNGDASAETTAAATADSPATTAVQTEINHVLTYRRDHPGNRCSYGIAGNAGIVVFDKGLFVNGHAPTLIELSADLVPVKADNKSAREAAAAQKLIEKAAKAQAKIEEATRKAAEKKAKADAALEAAKAKVAAAQAASVPQA